MADLINHTKIKKKQLQKALAKQVQMQMLLTNIGWGESEKEMFQVSMIAVFFGCSQNIFSGKDS